MAPIPPSIFTFRKTAMHRASTHAAQYSKLVNLHSPKNTECDSKRILQPAQPARCSQVAGMDRGVEERGDLSPGHVDGIVSADRERCEFLRSPADKDAGGASSCLAFKQAIRF